MWSWAHACQSVLNVLGYRLGDQQIKYIHGSF